MGGCVFKIYISSFVGGIEGLGWGVVIGDFGVLF